MAANSQEKTGKSLSDFIAELEEEEKQKVAEELQPYLQPNQELSRRQLMGLAGVVGAGSLFGGAGSVAAAQEMVQKASAADGVISDINALESGDGTPIQIRNDVDHQSNELLNVQRLNLTDQDIYVYASSGDLLQTIDVSGTSTPLADAAAVTGAAKAVLPPGTVQEGSTFNPPANFDVVGQGINQTTLEFTTDIVGISAGDNDEWSFRDLKIQSPGISTSTNFAIEFTGSSAVFKFERVKLLDWAGAVDTGTASPFSGSFEQFFVKDVDSGDKDGVFRLNGSGPPLSFGNIYVEVADTRTTSDSDVFYVDDHQVDIDVLNIGGTAQRAIENRNGYVTCRQINYEPQNQNGTPDSIVRQTGEKGVFVDVIKATSGTVDYVWDMNFNPANARLGRYQNRGATVNNTVVNVQDEPVSGQMAEFQGLTASDVTDNSSNEAAIHERDTKVVVVRDVKRNRGTATISSTGSSVTVSHGLDVTPAVEDISVVYSGSPNGGGALYLSSIGASSFDINSASSPSSDATVAWSVDTE